jgi:predicted RNase H-like nuclease (RuvC/YqgF family)
VKTKINKFELVCKLFPRLIIEESIKHMETWSKERENWSSTCRRLQGDNLGLRHEITQLKDKIRSIKAHHLEELAAKDQICKQLDMEILRLHDEINILELELSMHNQDFVQKPSTSDAQCQTNHVQKTKFVPITGFVIASIATGIGLRNLGFLLS